MKNKTKQKKEETKLVKLDLGCGPNKQPGFIGVDSVKFPGVDVVADITKPWPWKDNSVDEVHCAHTLEHLTNLDGKWERVHFFNELFRVLKKGAKATLIFPHWSSIRYYGDPTHKEPFSEFGFYYLDKGWRLGDKEKGIGGNAPHADASFVKGMYDCDFVTTWGYSLHPTWQAKNQETQQFGITHYKEVCQDIIATVIKK